MRLLFNKDGKGQEEIKKLLGFIDADLSYENLVSDIELQTPQLIDFISLKVYDEIADFYEGEQTGENADQLKSILKNAQLFILLTAYLEYAPNADLLHGNTGRKVHYAQDEKTAWDWQIRADNGALERRSYKALDILIDQLDSLQLPNWINSDQYKEAKSLFIYNTRIFQKAYPINNSSQLYYRLVPFMRDIEAETIIPTLGQGKYDQLKGNRDVDPLSQDGRLINYCRKIIAFQVMERASVLLSEEMLGETINYKMDDEQREKVRYTRGQRFLRMAESYEKTLQELVAEQNTEEYELDPLHGIKEGKKHVNL